jgi:hypothetical protein
MRSCGADREGWADAVGASASGSAEPPVPSSEGTRFSARLSAPDRHERQAVSPATGGIEDIATRQVANSNAQARPFANRATRHGPATSSRPAPAFSGRAWSVTSGVRAERPLGRPQETVTVEGSEAIPLATTTSLLLPAGVVSGRVNWVEELVPGATETELQSWVRA